MTKPTRTTAEVLVAILKKWERLPSPLRKRYWRETDYGAGEPSTEWITAAALALRTKGKAR